jgi:hypothetical protein
MSYPRITATHVGGPGPEQPAKRICKRCGVERSVSHKNDRGKPYMCMDCKSVDPAMARRLGLMNWK